MIVCCVVFCRQYSICCLLFELMYISNGLSTLLFSLIFSQCLFIFLSCRLLIRHLKPFFFMSFLPELSVRFINVILFTFFAHFHDRHLCTWPIHLLCRKFELNQAYLCQIIVEILYVTNATPTRAHLCIVVLFFGVCSVLCMPIIDTNAAAMLILLFAAYCLLNFALEFLHFAWAIVSGLLDALTFIIIIIIFILATKHV